MEESEASRRTTLLTVMLVTVFLAVLAVLIIPVRQHSHVDQRAANCGKNQSQIMGAMVAYSWSEEVAWPTPWAQGSGLADPKVADARAARAATCRAFEILAVHQKLPPSLFRCPAAKQSTQALITLKAAADGRNGGRWGMGPEGMVMYAWDWASPADPSAERVIIADRDPLGHGSAIMVCFGDAHFRKIKLGAMPVRSPGTLETEGLNGKAITVSVGNPEVGGDDIYSTEGDGEDPPEPDAKVAKPVPLEDYDPLAPTKGHPRKAWVK